MIALKSSIINGLVQNQPTSHILFHTNGSPRDLYIMTLVRRDRKMSFFFPFNLAKVLDTFFAKLCVKFKNNY